MSALPPIAELDQRLESTLILLNAPISRAKINFRDNLRRAKKVWPESGHPYEQRAITAKKSKAGWYPPQSDVELMTQKQILGSSRLRDLNRSTTNNPSACRIANIAFNDAMILAYDANPGSMEFFGKDSGS